MFQRGKNCKKKKKKKKGTKFIVRDTAQCIGECTEKQFKSEAR